MYIGSEGGKIIRGTFAEREIIHFFFANQIRLVFLGHIMCCLLSHPACAMRAPARVNVLLRGVYC